MVAIQHAQNGNLQEARKSLDSVDVMLQTMIQALEAMQTTETIGSISRGGSYFQPIGELIAYRNAVTRKDGQIKEFQLNMDVDQLAALKGR
ncbi:hypothetical protein BGX27_005756 [Mortierella sp. AM989]|nr:hypothetical protein BGX27_005756 [Mortierella sp. AM989]